MRPGPLVATLLATSFGPAVALADDDDWLAVVGVAGVGAVIGGDVALTALNIDSARTQQDHGRGVMIFQTAFAAPQAVLAHAPLIAGVIEYDGRGDDDLPLGLLGMGAGIWTNTLTLYSAWTLASTTERPDTRLGFAALIGANLTLTVGALASATRSGRSRAPIAPVWLAIPEMVVGTTGAAYGIYQAVRNDRMVPSGIVLSAWSTALVTHGFVSLVAHATGAEANKEDSVASGRREQHTSIEPVLMIRLGKPCEFGVMALGNF